MKLRAGMRLQSAVGDAQVVVVRAPAVDVDLACGGQPLTEELGEPPTVAGPEAAPDGGTILLGKRYADDEIGLEVLCTRPGPGSLTVDGRPLLLKGAKPLPSSD